MPEGGNIPPRRQADPDRRERLLKEAAEHLRALADICEALADA
jgi:hypothetical protein